ncbi:hypothetical protein Taro_016542 [Colocasia esculenta]|uniref:Uncharacterized protein n=1 Tax=Colocasia esculenta TaxID=4460 RepID=A0A843UNS6_COLES|nr:hypothetical protein [Colocasia esculenta]
MVHNQWQAMQDTVAGLTQALQNVVQAGNQATAASNGAGDLHRNFRSLNPPCFFGSPDPDEAENWQEEMNEFSKTPKHHDCLNTLHQTLGDEFTSCWGRVEEFLAAGELEIAHTKLFFFPFSSVVTCINRPLEVDQSKFGLRFSEKSGKEVMKPEIDMCIDLEMGKDQQTLEESDSGSSEKPPDVQRLKLGKC